MKKINYKGKEYTLTYTKPSSLSFSLTKYTLKDGNNIVFEVESFLPLLRKHIESAIDNYIKEQRKIKLHKLK